MATPTYFQRPSMSQWNRTNPLAGWDSPNTYQGWRTPDEEAMLNAPLSDDQYSLLLNKQVGDKSRKTRLAGDIQRAQDESAFLDSIQPTDTAGLFAAPSDARQARLQDLLNRDYKARELGSRLSMAGEREKTAMTWVTQKRKMELAALANSLANSRADNQRADQIFAQNTEDRAQNRELNAQRIQANNDYQNARLGQFDDSLANRVTNQTQQRELQKQQMELKAKMTEAANSRTQFGDWVRATTKGVPVGQLDAALKALWPTLSPSNQQVAMGYLAQRAQSENAVSASSDFYNREVLKTAQQLAAQNGGSIDSHFQTAVGLLSRQMNRDPIARGNLIADPNTGSMVPRFQLPTGGGFTPPGQTNQFSDSFSAPLAQEPAQALVQAPQSAQSTPQFVVGPDNYLYQIINGQPVRTNRRRQ